MSIKSEILFVNNSVIAKCYKISYKMFRENNDYLENLYVQKVIG